MEKKWYQSRIFLIGVLLALVGGTDLAFGWLSGQGITPEQVQTIETTLPDTAAAIKAAVAAKNYFGILTAVAGLLTAIFRAFYTQGSPLKFKA